MQKQWRWCLVLLVLLLVCITPVLCFAGGHCRECAEKKAVQAAAPKPVIPPAAPSAICNKEFTFDATRSYDPNNEKLSYLWNFGDGTTSTEPVVKHLYERGGEYTVTLTVKDTSGLECDTSVTTEKVLVKTPPQARCSGPESVCVGSEVTFDGSASTGEGPLTYVWDFGDGTKGVGSIASKTYTRGGNYTVTLTVMSEGAPEAVSTAKSGCAKCARPSCNTAICKTNINVNSVPTANAGEDVDMCVAASQELRIAFNGSRSHDPDGDKLTYVWNFGDGATAEGESVSHIYQRPGDYKVTLTVNDGRGSPCSSSSDDAMVRLSRSPIANAGKDIVTCVDSTVTLDGSLSQGDNLKYAWDFGDGSGGEGARVTHAYTRGGSYKAVLTVNDGKGTRCSTSSSLVNVMVSSAPEVTLDCVESTCLGNAVRFDASARGPALAYSWDFGDGAMVEGGSSQTHTYAKGGTYTVRVTVDDKKGTPCSMATATARIKVNSPPIANCGPNLVCCIGKETVFDGSGSSDPDGDALSYRWNFGDGATAEGVRVTHAYAKSGKYTVTLMVDDGSGTGAISAPKTTCGKCKSVGCSSSACSYEAIVSEHPVAVMQVR